ETWMGVPVSAAVTLGLLFFLSAGLNEQVAEGCKCLPRHPQQVFCESDIGKSNACIETKICIEALQVQKNGFPSCGAVLNNGEYLLSGRVMDGVIVFGLCDFMWPWDQLSSVQKGNLNMYRRGCVCEIASCTGASCLTKKLQRKCLIGVNNFLGLVYEEALQSVCLPCRDGFCRWRKMIGNYKSS
uniref:Tissue inhibitor of metalloproteinases 4 n=1 Tax=Sinocyclocheilus rhinocerous TaxID=307959 RepID=A0A673KNJ7_9TELE